MVDARFYETATALDYDAALVIAAAEPFRGGGGAISRVGNPDDADLAGAAIFIDDKKRAAAAAEPLADSRNRAT